MRERDGGSGRGLLRDTCLETALGSAAVDAPQTFPQRGIGVRGDGGRELAVTGWRVEEGRVELVWSASDGRGERNRPPPTARVGGKSWGVLLSALILIDISSRSVDVGHWQIRGA